MLKGKCGICVSVAMHQKQNQAINEHPVCSTVPIFVRRNL